MQERYSINAYRIKGVKRKGEKALGVEKFLQLLGLKMASFTDKEKLSPVMDSDIQYSRVQYKNAEIPDKSPPPYSLLPPLKATTTANLVPAVGWDRE